MTDTQVALESYTGKKIKVTVDQPGRERREITGKVDLANVMAMIVKEERQTMTTLIEASWIVPGSIEEIVEKPRELKARRLDPLTASNARHHLLDRHGWWLFTVPGIDNTGVNQMTDEEALTLHATLDHSILGHYHQPREELAEEIEESVTDAS